MIQCKDCEFYEIGPDGHKQFKCDPFSNIKEPECLQKWQVIKLDMLLGGYKSMLTWQERMSPVQDKILKYVQRELDDIDEAERWKVDDDEDEEEEDDMELL